MKHLLAISVVLQDGTRHGPPILVNPDHIVEITPIRPARHKDGDHWHTEIEYTSGSQRTFPVHPKDVVRGLQAIACIDTAEFVVEVKVEGNSAKEKESD